MLRLVTDRAQCCDQVRPVLLRLTECEKPVLLILQKFFPGHLARSESSGGSPNGGGGEL